MSKKPNFISFEGLEAINLDIKYSTGDGDSEVYTLTYTLKEIEADLNQMRGADNVLHPSWQKLGPADLDNFLSSAIRATLRMPLLHPQEVSGDEPVLSREVIPPHRINSIDLRGTYAGA